MTNPQAVEALPEELAERERFKAWAIEAGLMTAPDESGLCFKSDACRPAWAAWLMRSTLATQPAPQPEAQALPDSPSLRIAAQAAVAVRKRHGWSPEADAAIHALEAALSSPAPAPLTPDEAAYPRDVFQALIDNNSPYAFYLFQWVPYQTDALRWRLKMMHDVRTFDGREALGIWPNGSSCGPFKDHEVEFIRISRKQWGSEWVDPRPGRINGIGLDGGV